MNAEDHRDNGAYRFLPRGPKTTANRALRGSRDSRDSRDESGNESDESGVAGSLAHARLPGGGVEIVFCSTSQPRQKCHGLRSLGR